MAGSGWGASVHGRATRLSGIGLAVVFGIFGLQRRDGEAIVFALVTLAATAGTLVRRGLPGRIALGLVALDTIAWLAPAAIANVNSGEDLLDVAAPSLLCGLAATLTLLIVGVAPKTVLTVGSLVLVGVLGLAVAASGDSSPTVPEVTVVTTNMEFAPAKIAIRSGGLLGADNSDLFWHSFTIPELDIDIRIPTGATRLVPIEAPAGEYRFICAIPGHEAAGMHGVVIVR